MKEKASLPQLEDDFDETFDGVLEVVEQGPTHVDKLPDADFQKHHPVFADVCDESDVAAAKQAKPAPAPKQQ
jgi:hypothetical protein